MDKPANAAPAAEPRVPPNRLSAEFESPYYDAEAIKGLTVYRNGAKLSDVLEYSMSEGWARVPMKGGRHGGYKRERGKIVSVTLRGDITAAYND